MYQPHTPIYCCHHVLRGLLFGLFALGLGACADRGSTEQAQPVYFDLAGLIGQQVAQLGQLPAKATKSTQMNGKIDRRTGLMVNWEQELALFAKADLNKPVLREAYTIQKTATGITYTAKESGLVVEYLRISGLGAVPDSVAIRYHEKNTLYLTQREMYLTFANEQLRSYRIKGYQQMVLSDTVHYAVEGQVEQ